MRHVGHDFRPILLRILPDRRQSVALDAATNEQNPTELELRIVLRRSNLWRVVARFAAGQEQRQEEEFSHLKSRFRRSCVAESPALLKYPSLVRARESLRSNSNADMKRSGRQKAS